MKLISETQIMMKKIAVHQIQKKVKIKKNKNIINNLMKMKLERMMGKEY